MSKELIFRDANGAEYQPVKHHNRKTENSAYRVKPRGASNETDDCIELDSLEEVARAMLIDGLPARVKALAGGPVNYLKFGAQKLIAYELSPDIAERIGVPSTSASILSQADKIRLFVTERFIYPARHAGETNVEMVSGDIHKSMGLKDALPAVCSVLEGAAFAEQARVVLINRKSPIGSDKPSSTIRYFFKLKNAESVNLNCAMFDRLKENFLSQHPDFKSFSDCPSFAINEGDYKRALMTEAKRLVQEMSTDSNEALGKALIELLAGRTKLKSNLIDWRAQKVVDDAISANSKLVEKASGKLARAEDAISGVADFVETVWSAFRADLPSKPYAESRMVPSMLRALISPQEVFPIRSTPTNNAVHMLLGRAAFANAPLKREELADVTAMALEMSRVMDEDWEWAPRDLWDVQGFIWETCQERLSEGNEEMTDDELLKRFDGNPTFRKHRRSWSKDQQIAFCTMAREVNTAGLDWYHTNIPETRFGRKPNKNRDATGTLGTLQLRKDSAFLIFTHQHMRVDLSGKYQTNIDEADEFVAQMETARNAIANWQPLDPPRPGKWPDEYDDDGVTQSKDKQSMNPTNLILYGPPGTGKTYMTMEHAVRLCGETPENGRQALRDQYERLRDNEKRIEFVTFHQNFAYEEFVEGLRPQTNTDDETASAGSGFSLEPVAGIFRRLCARADEARKAPAGGPPFNLEGRRVFKMSLGRAGLEDEIFEEAWAENYIVLGWGGEIDWSDYDSYRSIHDRWNDDHPGTHGSDSNIAQVNRFVVDMKPGDIVVVSYGNSKIRAIAEVKGPYEFAPTETRDYNHRRTVRWLRRFETPIDASIISSANFSQKSCYPIQETNLDRAGLATLLPGEGKKGAATKQYVLVIDEINRANISKVFGELITLIEPDKRIGMGEELTVRLPYSKESFGVPANLHIVGTMNTADRSIMQIDTALRRRFRFEEMPPESRLLEPRDGVDIPNVLDVINARIEYLLDRDHAVGHAFFMGDGGKDRAAIDDTMRFKIIPLLQEYFFDDWRNIAAVLGKGFVRGTTLPVPPGIEDRGDRTRWTIRWKESESDGFPTDAYDLLLKGTEAEVNNNDVPDFSFDLDDSE